MKLFTLVKSALFVLTTSLVTLSCDKIEFGELNEIKDEQGITIDMDWKVNNEYEPLNYANLDLYVLRGKANTITEANNLILSTKSILTNSFEKVTLNSNLVDGDYTVVVDFKKADKAGTFTLMFNGVNTVSLYSLSNINFTSTDYNTGKIVAHIKKTGSQFTINKFQ
jgi:hypothetical protein